MNLLIISFISGGIMNKGKINQCYVPDYRRTILFNDETCSEDCDFFDGILCMLSCDVLETKKSSNSVDMLRCAKCRQVVRDLLED